MLSSGQKTVKTSVGKDMEKTQKIIQTCVGLLIITTDYYYVQGQITVSAKIVIDSCSNMKKLRKSLNDIVRKH